MEEVLKHRNSFLLFAGNLFSDEALTKKAHQMIAEILKSSQNYDHLSTTELGEPPSKKEGETYISGEMVIPEIFYKSNLKEKFVKIITEEFKNLFEGTGVKASIYYDEDDHNFNYYLTFNTKKVSIFNEKEGLKELVEPELKKSKPMKL